MKWKGRRQSSNIEDARGRQGPGRRVGAGAGPIVRLVSRTFGIKGVIALLVAGFIGWQMGLVDPRMLIESPQDQGSQVTAGPREQALFEFVATVLADTEDVWGAEFSREHLRYSAPRLVVYRNRVATGCGTGEASMGPFYCPADQKIYIDLSFYDELEHQFDAPGDFAQAYVIAHEVGHHVQNLLGTTAQVHEMRNRPDYNEYSVRLELQADYLAGVWANQNSQYLDPGDIEEAMNAANQIGDDALQMRAQGRVVPHAFTHGTSEQRMRWFQRGFNRGRLGGGDTFTQDYDAL